MDEPNQLLLVAMMDKCVYVYQPDDPMPLARWVPAVSGYIMIPLP